MYVSVVLIGFVSLLVAGHFFLSWLLVESPEDRQTREEAGRPPRNFYNPRTWAAFRRLASKRPALLMYRRDKYGRFRKLSPGKAPAPSRSVKRRTPRRPRRPTARHKRQVPAE